MRGCSGFGVRRVEFFRFGVFFLCEESVEYEIINCWLKIIEILFIYFFLNCDECIVCCCLSCFLI